MTKHKLKHQKIALYLEHLIRRGRLSTGDPLPSENELAKKFKVSRGTVRKAISNLQNKNSFVPIKVAARSSQFTHKAPMTSAVGSNPYRHKALR
ncbi:GntR family transcriptional regulator [Arcanobacterium canis]